MPSQPERQDTPSGPAGDVTHWNFGPTSRKPGMPTSDTRRDPNWYKRDTEQTPRKPGLLARLREVFR
jgi:hypothetical protein